MRSHRFWGALVYAARWTACWGAILTLDAGAAARFELAGDWEVRVINPDSPDARSVGQVLRVPPPEWVVVKDEQSPLPLFNPKASGWTKGLKLAGVRAQETTTPGLLDPESLVVRSGPGLQAETYQCGLDYDADLSWGTVGRLPNGRIKENQTVSLSYRYTPMRLDAVAQGQDGKILLRRGEPRAAAPQPPEVGVGERRLGNIYLPGPIFRLTKDHLFPILETAFPEPPKPSPAPAEKLLPKTMKKLRSGQPLRVLAWGDSVTDASYLPNRDTDRWQAQFVARLGQRFPSAKIELVTEAWGGRNTGSYLAEPPGSPHNYREKVLGAKPDLIVSEFVNDAGLKPAQVGERYGKLLKDFQEIGAEWIILTPHYVRPDWMGLTREREIDEDPRPYVAGLRQFAAAHSVALADASRRYGRLWRQGLPYNTLMLNSINHPDARGMKLFADALMELFP